MGPMPWTYPQSGQRSENACRTWKRARCPRPYRVRNMTCPEIVRGTSRSIWMSWLDGFSSVSCSSARPTRPSAACTERSRDAHPILPREAVRGRARRACAPLDQQHPRDRPPRVRDALVHALPELALLARDDAPREHVSAAVARVRLEHPPPLGRPAELLLAGAARELGGWDGREWGRCWGSGGGRRGADDRERFEEGCGGEQQQPVARRRRCD
jgi:hypothetical protein